MIEFKEPPPAHKPNANYEAIAAALRERPGEWALVLVSKSGGYAGHIKNGSTAAFRPSGHYEATSRVREDGEWDIYARYVGDDA